MDNKLSHLKETWQKVTEMPAWNDNSKDIANNIDPNLSTLDQRRSEMGYKKIKKVKLTPEITGYLYNRPYSIILDLVDEKNNTVAGEFIWSYDSSKKWYTETVGLIPQYQGKGLAIKAYIYVIDNIMKTLYSDQTLTGESGKGSFDVWVKLGNYFPYSYLYDISEDTYTEVDGFTREMMGNKDIRFVVSKNPIKGSNNG